MDARFNRERPNVERTRANAECCHCCHAAVLGEWVATVELADPLLRHFAAELCDLEAAGADPRWAMIVLLREAARLEVESLATASLELAAA